jgi:hypothetical protein
VKARLLRAIHFIGLALFAFVLAAFQTSGWYKLFSYLTPPTLWLPVLVYVGLYRSTILAIFFGYLVAVLVAPLTSMSEGTLLISTCLVVLATQSFKRRIYWPAFSYVMLISSLGSLLFSVVQWLVGYILASESAPFPSLFDWLLQALLTPLFAPLIFWGCRWIERFTQQEQIIEFTAEVN